MDKTDVYRVARRVKIVVGKRKLQRWKADAPPLLFACAPLHSTPREGRNCRTCWQAFLRSFCILVSLPAKLPLPPCSCSLLLRLPLIQVWSARQSLIRVVQTSRIARYGPIFKSLTWPLLNVCPHSRGWHSYLSTLACFWVMYCLTSYKCWVTQLALISRVIVNFSTWNIM